MGLFSLFRSTKDRKVEEVGEKVAVASPLDEAERLIDKGNAIEEEKGQLDEAMRCYEEALAMVPDLARAHMNRGNILLARGDKEGALSAYQKATDLDPAYAAAYYNAGNAYAQLGRHEAARTAYEKAIDLKPLFVDAYVALGCALEDLGDRDKAVASYQRALEIEPYYAEVHANIGKVLLVLGEQDRAIRHFERSVELIPDDGETLFILGIAQKARGYFEPARSSLGRAQAILTDNIEARIHLGDTLLELEQANEAIDCYRKILEIVPDNAVVHNNLGNAYFTSGYFAEAVASYRRATELQPDFASAHSNLGGVLKDIGESLEGIKSIRRALEIAPEVDTTRSNLLFISNSLDHQSQDLLLEEATKYGEIVTSQAKPITAWQNTPEPERILRIGLVSADLCYHPVGFFIEGVLRAITSTTAGKLEFFAYMNFYRSDSVSERIKALCHRWREIFGLSDEECVQLIQRDGIDILIDLSGHTGKTRLPIFAWKPAPIQVSWLGYFATTGVDAIDYLIADPWTLPESEEQYFTETIWRLPDTRLCFTPPDENVTIGRLPMLSESTVTFGCFNSLIKMNDEVVSVWARLLSKLPDSRLLLKARQLYHPAAQTAVLDQFSRQGVAAQRLVLEGPADRAGYLASYNRIDIALDPFPYTGGTTTAEALWMGVPVLTLAGKHFLARQGVGLLANAGLHDWIATDARDYVARAVSHAADSRKLAELRLNLRERVLASPVFDAHSFAIHLDNALRSMWKIWCAKQT